MSEHQVHKYQKIVETLPRRQLNKFKKGEISLEKAYKLARAAPVKQDKTGRASELENRVRKSEDLPGASELSDEGPASDLEEKTDTMKTETGRESILKADVPEVGETSAAAGRIDAETGRTSELEYRVRKRTDLSGPAELSDDGPASTLEKRPDAMEAGTGRASKLENRVRKSADFPGAPEFAEEESASALEEKPDAMEPKTGRASILKMDAAETAYGDPETYQEAISLLNRLPTAPGDTCAIRNGEKIVIGTVDRMEIYRDALLISVLVDGIRRPYPVSLVGTDIFLGPDCYRQAEEGQNASSF